MLHADMKTGFIALLLLSMLSLAVPAAAQPVPIPETVANRGRPNLDPLGVRLGSFTLFPEFGLRYMNDDNVYASNENTLSDNAYTLSPGITLRSDWNRNSLIVGANAALSRYEELKFEDHDDSEVFVRGRWDTANNGAFTGEISSSIDHEGRDSADAAQGFDRTRFATDRTTLDYQVRPGKMLFEAEIDMARLDFDDVMGLDGPISNDDRDRDTASARLRVGYEVFNGYALFVEGRSNTVEYDSRFDRNGFERSAEGDEFVFGAAMNVTEILFGNVFYGRKSQTYDDERFAKIRGPAFGVDVGWNITQLTTLTFSGRRQVSPTTIIGASGVDETRYGLRADHELLRNLILTVDWGDRTDDFKGIERRDQNRTSTFAARYLMHRKLELEFQYTSRDRDSNAAAILNFSKRIISIQIKGQI